MSNTLIFVNSFTPEKIVLFAEDNDTDIHKLTGKMIMNISNNLIIVIFHKVIIFWIDDVNSLS